MNSVNRGNNYPDTYAEINLHTLRNNYKTVKEYANKNLSENVKICSIVKANAYGHGMNEIGKVLSESGTDYLGTADYYESIQLSDYLKKHSKKNTPVLCLGILTDTKLFKEVVSRNIDITVTDIKIASKLNDFAKSKNKRINVQIQVDSGINRIGFKPEDTYDAVQKMQQLKNLNLKGIYSHFATSETDKNPYTHKQLKEFKILVKEIESNLTRFELKHISNSGGILNITDPFFNMVRPGISLYGYYPDRSKVVKDIGIKPVMTLKTRVKFIKTLEKNRSISYGRKYFTRSNTKIASLPVGYGDGYSRLLTNKAKVYIKGKLYDVAGTVCMDWVMVEIGNDSKIKVNDEVIMFGKEYPADNLSEIIRTIPYEITCNISQRVKRIYKEK
jgi:alanine racemase